MAAVEITISGVLYDKYNRTQQNVVLIGEATLSGLQVGGGPMPGGPGSGAHPEHPIFYPPGSQPHPEHPIFYPPGSLPHPEHPIVLPPNLPPTLPPPDSRPIEWKAAWTPATGWVVVGVPTGPHPVPSAAGKPTQQSKA